MAGPLRHIGELAKARATRSSSALLPRLDPRAVVPTHYDNFFRPLGGEMEFVANVKLSELPEAIGAISRDIELAALVRADISTNA